MIDIPHLFALAMQADGWWLRSEIIWAKPNPMPESVKDRPSKAHETIFLLTKSQTYYYDKEAVSEVAVYGDHPRNGCPGPDIIAPGQARQSGFTKIRRLGNGGNVPGPGQTRRNLRDVWTLTTRQCKTAHFATFPEKLAETCILAGTSAHGVCPECGRPWRRDIIRRFHPQEDVSIERGRRDAPGLKSMDQSNGWEGFPRGTTDSQTIGWIPSCDCASEPTPAVVLDPFVGSGTVCRVAETLGRRAVGLDLSWEYLDTIARPYCAQPVQRKLINDY